MGMRRVLLLHQTEGAALMRKDLASLDVEVEIAPLSDYEQAMGHPDIDAVIVGASANLDETSRLVESPTRPARAFRCTRPC